MQRDYPMSPLMPKFMFLEALAYVTDKNTEGFKNTLMELLERYPDTDITPYASSYLKGLAQGRELQQSGGGNMRGMLWDIRLGSDSTAVSDEQIEFDLNPDTEQYLVLLFPTDRISQNALLYEVARHNFSSFVVKDFDLEQMNFGRLGLLLIKGFENVEEINHYRKVMAASPTLQLPAEVRPVVISAANFDTLLRNGRSFDEYFRYMRDKTYRDTEEAVLPPELFGESEGLTPEEAAEDTAPIPGDAVMPSDATDMMPDAPSTLPDDMPAISEPEQTPEKPQTSPDKTNEVPGKNTTSPETHTTTAPQEQHKPDKPQEKPKPNTPVENPKPAAPVLPEYEPGSEGDDPLLD